MSVQIITGDCRSALDMLTSASIDAIVTDPPYGLEFMGKEWDSADGFRRALNKNDAGRDNAFGRASARGPEYRAGGLFQEWTYSWAVEALRVLKPGGHMLAFGGTRTYHRLACAIEDAGFEIRDQIGWAYGSGFTKSSNQEGEWEGWGTALKPAWEPIVMARKPLIGTVPRNLAEWGVGALNIDGCRVEYEDTANPATNPLYRVQNGYATKVGSDSAGSSFSIKPDGGNITAHALGRWPANLIHDGSDEVTAAFPQAPGQLADASSSSSRKTQNVYGAMKRGNGRENEASADSDNDGVVGFKMKPGARRADAGSAARFFYCAKASKSDRNEGVPPDADGKPGNIHPTVKPTALMRYLCRLVTPPGGIVLDPFMGSGSTGKAAVAEGFNFIGVEQDPKYVAIAKARLGLLPKLEGVFA